MSKMGLFHQLRHLLLAATPAKWRASQERSFLRASSASRRPVRSAQEHINGDWEYTYLPILLPVRWTCAPSAPKSAAQLRITARPHAWNTATWRSSPRLLSSSRARRVLA